MNLTTRLTAALLFVVSTIYGQTSYNISGKILDSNNDAIAFANVLLMRVSDSTFVKGAVTDEIGAYILESIPANSYYIEGSVVGFQTARSEAFTLNTNYTVPVLVMTEGEELGEVVVQAKKPLFTQKVDRLVINVENSIVSSGGTALEVLNVLREWL